MDIKTYVEQRSLGVEDYANGLTHGLEIAVGFAEWVEPMFKGTASGVWKCKISQTYHKTSDLLAQYLDTLKTK